MLDLILLVLFIGGLFAGFKRGLIVQLIHMLGFIVALLVAVKYYKPLAEKFVLWVPYPAVDADSRLTLALDQLNLSQTFYQLLAFAIIFFAVWIGLQLLASMFDFLSYLPVLGFLSKILGAVLGVVEAYILLFLVIYVLALLPIGPIQDQLSGSAIAQMMLEHTPYFSEKAKEWWFIYTE